MTLVKMYNYEKYSVLDIQEYLHKKGYKTEMVQNPGGSYKMRIIGTHVYIDVPYCLGKLISAAVRFENYPKKENYEKDKKLYQFLARKYGKKKGEIPKEIKDKKKIPVEYAYKGIWPFNKIF